MPITRGFLQTQPLWAVCLWLLYLPCFAQEGSDVASLFDGVREYTLIVEELPPSTPHDATLYATGNFNSWNPGNEKYRLRETENGNHVITIRTDRDTIWWKFTRGNWPSVEARSNGLARRNRRYVYKGEGPNKVYLKVLNWEDIDGGRMDPYVFWLFFGAMQGFLLVAAINGLQENNRKANLTLSVLILLISFGLLGRIVMYYRDVFHWEPKLLLFPDFIYFLYGPCFYFYVKALLTEPRRAYVGKWHHFLPFAAHVLIYSPLIFTEKQTFIDGVVDEVYRPLFAGAGGVALVFNAYYWYLSHKVIRRYRSVIAETISDDNLAFLNTIMKLQAVCLLIWLCTAIAYTAGKLLGYDTDWATEYSVDAIWLVFAAITCFLGYFAINRPEILRIPERPAEPKKNEPIANIASLSQRLAEVMEQKKPFLNAKLTLAELSDTLGVSPAVLSRVINEGRGQNFYDFVNGYRVEEFKRRLEHESARRYTLLSLAHDVGFNSKTAFNRAFKKFTGQTPSEYYRQVTSRQP